MSSSDQISPSILADQQDKLLEYLDFSHELAQTARKKCLPYFRTKLDFESKKDLSPVTVADQETEAALREMISTKFPKHGILGEEQGFSNEQANEFWVIDPIDGTKSFITGVPTFGTLIALMDGNKPLLGLVDMPALNERWSALSGGKTHYNGTPCQTSTCTKLAEASIFATSIDFFTNEEWQAFDRMSKQAAIRRFGGDCYSYCLLASGHVDGVVESSLQPYDYLPLVSIIEGAGGVITDWDGKALNRHSDGRVVAAATQKLHQEILSQLS